jgi:hypothetical protein
MMAAFDRIFCLRRKNTKEEKNSKRKPGGAGCHPGSSGTPLKYNAQPRERKKLPIAKQCTASNSKNKKASLAGNKSTSEISPKGYVLRL